MAIHRHELPFSGYVRPFDLVAAFDAGGHRAAQPDKLAHAGGLEFSFVPEKLEMPQQIELRGFNGHQTAAPESLAQRQSRDAAEAEAELDSPLDRFGMLELQTYPEVETMVA